MSGMRSYTNWGSQPHDFARSSESLQIRWRASISRWKRRSALRSRLYRPLLKDGKLSLAGDAEGALKLFQRAVELDPNLALAYGRMGAAYLFLGNTELSAASYTRAYQLRDRLTERDRLNAEIDLLRPGDRRLGEGIFFRASFLRNISSGCARSCQPPGCICVSRPSRPCR